MSKDLPTIRAVRARAVNVPMPRPLQTGGGAVSTMPLVLVDLETDAGLIGRNYVFCYTPAAAKPTAQLIENMGAWIVGDALAPVDIEAKLQRRLRLIGPQGLTGLALAGIDTAAWDAMARLHGLPLVRLLGGAPRPIPAYNSCGLGLMGAERTVAEARELLVGFNAVKLRLGYASAREDAEVAEAVRRALGDRIAMMVDYNQALTVAEAVARVAAIEQFDPAWIEEPTRADDYEGHARIVASARLPVQLGENWWGPNDMTKSIAAGASDLVMPDAVKIGGVSGWLRASSLAASAGLPMSSHLFPEVSAHLLAITPTAHWLEYVDWASPILAEPARVVDGAVTAGAGPGIGIAWNETAVQRFLL